MYDTDILSNGRYAEYTIARFACNPFHSLHGNDTATCEPSGLWSHQTPTCNGNETTFIDIDFCF